MNTFERIELLVKKQKKSKSTVARECGLNINAFSDWKKGKAKPSTDSIVKIASFFGVTTDYLLCVSDHQTSPEIQSSSNRQDDEQTSQIGELVKNFEELPNADRLRVLGYINCLTELRKKK